MPGNPSGYLRAVLRSDNNRNQIKHCIVYGDLPFEPVKRILVALYLIADESTVYDSDIRSARAVLQAEFIHNQCIVRRVMPAQYFSVDVFSYLSVCHFFRTRQDLAARR